MRLKVCHNKSETNSERVTRAKARRSSGRFTFSVREKAAELLPAGLEAAADWSLDWFNKNAFLEFPKNPGSFMFYFDR